jgi:hypothetical protein
MNYDQQLGVVHTAMSDEQTTPAELAAHDISSRLAGIETELDYLISVAKNYDHPGRAELMNEVRSTGRVAAHAETLGSFVDAMQQQHRVVQFRR